MGKKYIENVYTPPMTTFVALLRGINVGGNKKVPMADLKKLLTKLGFENVSTLLNSGNASFDAKISDAKKLTLQLEKALQDFFGFPIPVIVRTKKELEALKKADPFKGIKVTADTRLYVTFLTEKPTSKLKIPYVSPGKEFRILQVTSGEVLSVLNVKDMGSVDAMAIVEKEFGKNVTTRNWNTVEKLLKSDAK